MLISRARTIPNLIWLVNIRVNVFYYICCSEVHIAKGRESKQDGSYIKVSSELSSRILCKWQTGRAVGRMNLWSSHVFSTPIVQVPGRYVHK